MPSSGMEAAEMRPRMSTRQARLWATSGWLFVALVIASLVINTALASAPYPSPFAPVEEIERYFAANSGAVRASGFLGVLAATSLLAFVAFVASTLRAATGDDGPLPSLALGGGLLASGSFLLSGLLGWVLARAATVEAPAVLRALHELTFLAGGPAHVLSLGVFVGASSIATLGRSQLPRWLSWLGVAAASLSLMSAAALLWTPATVLLPLGRLLAAIWIIGIGIVLARRSPVTEAGRA